ncbi:4-hydroxybutyrate CoA-transferase [Anaerovirgula multivorans]|uniref:4-hydroxybutyrate CoA-transferase n=1 Tax=Anaerovirgula multivorans TaxID=312168 RepID=A0A239CZ97_9FIRM|nr:acetyl-CoA hydrolase/transferase C-terminal domain-containing protein [Anaerovirgula multivorans]SNS25440.1 4-hydroxybutyrate CoA-transferase [Anaerovirgula multivorans]
MNWKEAYNQKLCDASQAVKNIKSRDRVVIGHASGEPQILVKAMVDNHKAYEKVEIVHMVAMGSCEYVNPSMEKHFIHNGLFLGGNTRKAVEEGRGDYTPSFFFQIPNLFKDGILSVDVVLIQVSKPDEHGFCSYGISCDYTKSAAESAKLVIAQVNKNMPRTLGECFIHIDDMDYIVESDDELIELKPPMIGEIESKIGKYCASLIEDGATLQLGIGAIPDAVLSLLKEKNDLGIHSEMLSDGILGLIENGNITNQAKTLHKGKSVVTFLMGTRKLYNYVHNNPSVMLCPVDYVNHPSIISQNNKMISINSAIQVDLMGQVAAESIGYKQFSGTGGQVDFVRGASMSQGGKSIIAMPSVAGKGKVSRIMPILDEGAAVTTSRNDVQFIVTEYGIGDLRGKTLRDRARELIKIAHPSFRDMLYEKAKEKFKEF